MKDAYSFDVDQAGAEPFLQQMFVAYLRTFAAMGLKFDPNARGIGPIGGQPVPRVSSFSPTPASRSVLSQRLSRSRRTGCERQLRDRSGLQSIVDK